MIDRYTVVPIDIDFAGWSQVPEGQHNAWGIVHLPTTTLRKWAKLREEAEALLNSIMTPLNRS